MKERKSSFKIVDIYAGWFEIILSDGNQEVIVTNSDFLGNDAPKNLLSCLIDLLNKKEKEIWLCWHDEPSANIINIKNKDHETFTISVFSAVKESFELPYEGDILSNENKDKCYLTFSIPIALFIKDVQTEFSYYSLGVNFKLYEEEWGKFPKVEFELLSEGIKQVEF